jgi:hypothetical protein
LVVKRMPPRAFKGLASMRYSCLRRPHFHRGAWDEVEGNNSHFQVWRVDQMKVRTVTPFVCRAVVGIGSFFVSAYSIYSFEFANLKQDTFAMSLFCALPLLSFPAFLLSFRSLLWSVRMHWILAAGYLAVYSMLDWRTCSERGYCHGAARIVLQTLTAKPVETVLAVAVLNLAALLLRGKRPSAQDERKTISSAS